MRTVADATVKLRRLNAVLDHASGRVRSLLNSALVAVEEAADQTGT